MDTLFSWGIALITMLQQLSPALDGFMEFFTFMGKVEFYMLFITLLYWVVDPLIGLRVFMILLSTDFVSASVKILSRQPRPYWLGEVKGISTETSYGLPSSHSSDSLAVWTYLAYQIKKRWMWIASIVIFFLISFSRLYLGVHFPQDVLLGWLIGLLMVFLFARYEKQFSGWFGKMSMRGQILFGFVISLGMGMVGILIQAGVSGMSDPAGWSSFSTEARTVTGHFTLAGALFGSILGYILMKRYVLFNVEGSWLQKVGRYVVGIIGVVVILYGLDPLFGLIAGDESALGYVLRYVRYGSATCWAMVGAPWVFIKLKLAKMM